MECLICLNHVMYSCWLFAIWSQGYTNANGICLHRVMYSCWILAIWPQACTNANGIGIQLVLIMFKHGCCSWAGTRHLYVMHMGDGWNRVAGGTSEGPG